MHCSNKLHPGNDALYTTSGVAPHLSLYLVAATLYKLGCAGSKSWPVISGVYFEDVFGKDAKAKRPWMGLQRPQNKLPELQAGRFKSLVLRAYQASATSKI